LLQLSSKSSSKFGGGGGECECGPAKIEIKSN
jgi:hypothetical protein